ncbi:MAG TPA: ComF family protein [bacterium]|nr:ComF family protein [bacterium]
MGPTVPVRYLETLWRSGVDLLFPKCCQNCGDPFRQGLSNVLCQNCWDSIRPYVGPFCSKCGASLPSGAFEGAVDIFCTDCTDGLCSLDGVRSLGPYRGALRVAHHVFKFEGLENLAKTMALKMVETIPRPGVDALVPVPMSQVKEREKGYNPVLALALALGSLWGLPVQRTLGKVRSTPPQMSLGQTERLANPKGAFSLTTGSPLLERVMLVDDVLTTGATLEECAKVLKRSGTSWTGAVVWGRTPKDLLP